MSVIKINRARNLAEIGKYPRSFDSMLDLIPEQTINSLSSKNLAALIDNVWKGCQEAKGLESIEICDQGYIWDSRQNKMRDLVN
jgi:hypothetical protein